jgi:hypothetical protein
MRETTVEMNVGDQIIFTMLSFTIRYSSPFVLISISLKSKIPKKFLDFLSLLPTPGIYSLISWNAGHCTKQIHLGSYWNYLDRSSFHLSCGVRGKPVSLFPLDGKVKLICSFRIIFVCTTFVLNSEKVPFIQSF